MSKCPVKSEDSAAQEASWSSWFKESSTGNASAPVPPILSRRASNTSENASSCPMNKDSSVAPASIEEAANHAQTPLPDQRISLRTERQISSIPRDAVEGGDGPHHQHDKAATNWVYPSEQQLYNAMRRKGWQNIPEDSIPLVLQIHNVINEGTWGKVVDWEGSPDVRLARFQGRPKDITPKAFFMSYVLGYYAPPFDRHDWYVEDPVRRPGELQRYVIDYYMIEPPPGSAEANLPPQPYVDARPAWEGPRGMSLRATRFLQDALPGISAYWNRFSAPRAAAGEQKKGG